MRAEQLSAVYLAIAIALSAAPTVRAEPYFMVRQGAKCLDCHVNQTGGGMRTPFANIHARDILHDLDLLPIPAGVKAFRGDVTPYISIGSDLRVRNTSTWNSPKNSSGNVPQNRAFRSNFDSNETSVQEFLGYAKVDLWPDVLSAYMDESLNGGATNREALGLIRGFLPWDTYVKFGRLFPTYGLRVWDDEAYIRSKVGYTFQNPDVGGEIGFAPGPFFLATSLTNGQSGDKDVAVTVNGYAVFEDVPYARNVLAGASYGRQSDKIWTAGWYAGANLWKFTGLGEFDVIDDRTVASAGARSQYAAYAELHLLLFDWLDLRGEFDFVKVSSSQSQVRYVIGAEPFISRFLQPRIQYRINNGPKDMQQLNTDQLVVELHMFF